MTRDFKPDDHVQDIRDRRNRGKVTAGPEMRGGRLKVRVAWEDGSAGWYSPGLLAPASVDTTLEGLLRDRAFGGHDDFVRNYTHRKLLTPVDDTLYTLSASRTRILAHQFKPLLRFLDSVHRRYLIADEVGLGKTIEAGIVIAELRARKALGGVLILCPNHLRSKWKAELYTRFDEDFEIVQTRKDWLGRMARFEEDGTDGARLIVGHKTVGARKLYEAAEQGVPAFDLIIVDEAHYARNTATYFRRLLGELSDAANQLLLLTATPLQTRVENLLSLMRLVDEDAFRNRDLFDDRLAVNRGLVRAERALRRTRIDQASLRQAVTAATEAIGDIRPWDRLAFGLTNEDGLPIVEKRLGSLSDASDLAFRELAEVADGIRELNLLSGYITRTRKIDVQDGCQRRVSSLRPNLSLEEQGFYRAAVAWMRRSVEERHGRGQVGFLTREPERRLASCFHGFWQRVQGRGLTSDNLFQSPPRTLVNAYAALGRRDTKYDQLLQTLRQLHQDDPGAKVLVFASFHATIRYLRRRLAEDGVPHEWIHGGITMDPSDPEKDERGRRVKRFLEEEDCRVLISSNVGGEGLDLQRASVVVNYDLPWNPAVVEQRIGRVDRYGQDRSVVQVVNFLLPDTVEDLVYFRLLERLRLFEDTVGDLARVLGPLVKQLSSEFLGQDLTPDQIEERLRDAETQSRNRIEGRRGLLEREGEFIAFDEDFSDRLEDMKRSGQTIRPDEVARVCQGVIQKHFKGAYLRLVEEADRDEGEGRREGDTFTLYVDYRLREVLKAFLDAEPSSVLLRFLAKVPEGTPRQVTFSGEVAERDPDVLLLTTRHPFVRALVSHAERAELFHPVSCVRVPRAEDGGDTRGLLVVSEAELKFGPQKRRYLLPFLVSEAGVCLGLESSRRVLRTVLDVGVADSGKGAPDGDRLHALFEVGREAAEDYLGALGNRLYEIELRRVRPRVAETTARFDRRIASAEERIRQAGSETEEEEKRLKRLRQYRNRLKREKTKAIEELERIPDPEETFRPVGAAWIEVV